MEEARAFVFYYKQHSVTVEELAHRVGRKSTYVRERMKLLKLTSDFQQMLKSGQMNVSIAMWMCKFHEDIQISLTQFFDIDQEGNYVVPTLNYLKSVVRKNYMYRLDEAPFDIADANLIPAVGNCLGCQSNTGCNKTLFPELNSSIAKGRCTNIGCYHKKLKEYRKQTIQEYHLAAVERDAIPTYISTSQRRSQALEDDFAKVYYSDQYEMMSQAGTGVVTALVVNDDSDDYLKERFVKLIPAKVEQSTMFENYDDDASRNVGGYANGVNGGSTGDSVYDRALNYGDGTQSNSFNFKGKMHQLLLDRFDKEVDVSDVELRIAIFILTKHDPKRALLITLNELENGEFSGQSDTRAFKGNLQLDSLSHIELQNYWLEFLFSKETVVDFMLKSLFRRFLVSKFDIQENNIYHKMYKFALDG